MNIYTWYFVFDLADFADTELVSRTYTLNLEDIGFVDILVTKGVGIGMLYNGVFLGLNMVDQNPFEFDSHAIYIDADNQVWLGILDED